MPLMISLGLGGASLATGLMGSSANKKAAQKSAALQQAAGINSQAVNNEVYGIQQEAFKPYLEFGTAAAPGIEESMAGTYDYRGTPEYSFRNELGQNALQGALGDRYGQAAGGMLQSGLDLDENDQSYGRLLDRIKIGQGAVGQTGASNTGYGNALANAYNTQAQRTGASNRNISNINQDMWGKFGEGASSIPSYLKQNNYLRSLNQMGN